MPDSPKLDRDPAPAVTRSIRILGLLAESRGTSVGISEISRSLDIAKSSVSNICSVLEAGRLIQKRDAGYVLGHRTVELGGAYLASFDQVQEFYRLCAGSQVLSHELVQLAMLDGTEVLFLGRHEGQAPLRLTASIGDRYPAATTAVGNALLSLLDDDEIVRRFADASHFPEFTDRSTRDLDDLLARLARARDAGHAVDDGGVHPGVFGIAITLAPRRHSEPLAIGVSLMKPNASSEHQAEVLTELKAIRTGLSNPLAEPS